MASATSFKVFRLWHHLNTNLRFFSHFISASGPPTINIYVCMWVGCWQSVKATDRIIRAKKEKGSDLECDL